MTESQGSGGRIVRRGPYPEFTWTAVLLGYGIGIIITISLGYAALILGFSHEGSELAAIGMLLRILVDWRRGLRYSEEVGIPVAAGFIVGEGLMGVGFAVSSVVAGMMG